ncbi:MAG: carboxymuconolactone decarboxylase family protein [Burkholderiales bacterium]|nr:carboxymuconolactone decarboxylase family protein [Burkholderiales bacterium]
MSDSTSNAKFEVGMKARREVLGDAYVDRSLANATAFTAPLQELVTENCWGAVWSRDGLDRRTRSLVTISMLIALRATDELKTHVLGALRNGCTVEEIREVLLHASAYCGFPAALDAFRAAKEVVENWEKSGAGQGG